jgi:hypothetical protein
MINEEMTQKDINLAVRVGGITYEFLKKAMEKLIAELETGMNELVTADKTPELKEGKQTLEQLKKHREGLTPLELTDPNLRLLNSEMKKAKIDFSVTKDGKGKYLLHFKGKDTDEMTRAFKNYTEKLVKLEQGSPTINAVLSAAKKLAQTLNAGRDKVKNMDKGAR